MAVVKDTCFYVGIRNLGLFDFIKIAITYMNIYVFSHNGKLSQLLNQAKFESDCYGITTFPNVERIAINQQSRRHMNEMDCME